MEEFGHAELGDMRRTKRLVSIAAGVAIRPAGKVTQVFTESKERESAFRFVENGDVNAAAIAEAARISTALRCEGMPFVYVPVDQTDLRVTDREDNKSLGCIGDARTTARGFQVMNAIGVAPDGTPLGMLGQVFWTRPPPMKNRPKKDRRAPEEKESTHWLEVIEQARSAISGTTRPWFQIDRAGDAWQILLDAQNCDAWLTVRSQFDRRLRDESSDEQTYLWAHLAQQVPLGSYDLEVPATPSRRARRATMVLQACEVTLDLQLWPVQKRVGMPVWAVRTVEVGTTPKGEEPIEWRLLTTHEVRTLHDAHAVVVGYATRWTIEQLHKLWKSGACHVEDTQLGDAKHIERWATILASVAMRLLRLMHLSRRQPVLPATVEMTRSEIDAVILIRKPPKIRRGMTPTISELVRWIADLGGYTGKSSGGPPGAIVISRGLAEIRAVAALLGEGEL